jgi:hypothetical protein
MPDKPAIWPACPGTRIPHHRLEEALVIQNRLGRVAAITALSIAAAGRTVALARPASAAGLPPPKCYIFEGISWSPQTDPTQVRAYDYTECLGEQPVSNPVTLYEMVGGTPVVVATGTGYAEHICQGNAPHTYSGGDTSAVVDCG